MKRVAISQFSVEFVTENTNKSGASAISVLGALEMAGVGKRKREFAEDFKQQLPNPLYESFVSALKAEGFDVVPVEELQRQPAFADMKRAAAGGEYGQGSRTGNVFSSMRGSESAKLQVYPVSSLPMLDDSWFNGGDNIRAEWKMAGDTGAQAVIRVRMRVGLDDDGHAVLGGGSTISVAYEPEKQQWQMNKPADWIYKQRHSLASQGSMRDDVSVVDSKEFQMFKGDIYQVNGPKFQESVMKMYPTYAHMAAILLKTQ